jgi:hypothetical protein
MRDTHRLAPTAPPSFCRPVLRALLPALIAIFGLASCTASEVRYTVDSTIVDDDASGRPDAIVDTGAEEVVEIDPGEFGAPCSNGGECLSGYCIYDGDAYTCTQFCIDTSTCPENWTCRTLANAGGDAVSICIPDTSSLCSPCERSEDCGILGDLCITLENTSFCAQQCADSADCPEGYFCTESTDVAGGVTALQCQPQNGRCSCRPEDVGTSRSCVYANSSGVCTGEQICDSEIGWSQCTAQTPGPELCDGADNNCNGIVDDTLEPRPCTSTPNTYGVCQGTERCNGTTGWVCDAPTASIEICDGLDNDCNGIIDDGLCYDGNDCTLDICDAGTGACSYPPRVGACDDGNACTSGDRCLGTTCAGEAINCDDGNPCTADTCNAVLGCQWNPANGAPCETGNLCTNDTCQDGSCRTGTPVACSSGPCIRGSCDPSRGCVEEYLTGPACDDDDGCTLGDTCSGGACVPGRSYCEGRSCSNCTGDFATLGGFCQEVFGSPTCVCVCL